MPSRRTSTLIDDLTQAVTITDGTVPGRHGDIPVRRYRPQDERSGVHLVWLHGGAFVEGGLDQLESHAVGAALANEGVEVTAVDYRLVPRWKRRGTLPATLDGIRFPVPQDDVVDALNASAAHGEVLVLGGASAGACLAASTALRQQGGAGPQPHGLVLAYGMFHAELPPAPEHLKRRLRGGYGLFRFRPEKVRRIAHNYAGSHAATTDPRAFPGGHDVTGLPPTLLVDADHDSLRASGEAFARELEAAGVETTHGIVPGTIDGFFDNPPRGRGFHRGTRMISEWLAARRGSSGQADMPSPLLEADESKTDPPTATSAC